MESNALAEFKASFFDGATELRQLHRLRMKLVEMTEEVSCKMEANMKPGVAASLKGDERAKARHLFLTQAKKIEAQIRKLNTMVENFQNHVY